jgi:hypothetical protein
MSIVLYHEDYCARRFPRATTARARQKLAVRHRLPVIRAGRATLIDEAAGDARLLELALHQDAPSRRGRPRTQER